MQKQELNLSIDQKNYDNMKGSTMNTTTDRRVRRTKKQLTESLAKLLCEKPLKKITVREISELADIKGAGYIHQDLCKKI